MRAMMSPTVQVAQTPDIFLDETKTAYDKHA